MALAANEMSTAPSTLSGKALPEKTSPSVQKATLKKDKKHQEVGEKRGKRAVEGELECQKEKENVTFNQPLRNEAGKPR